MVKKRAIVIKFKAGQKIHISAFAKVLLAFSGRSLHFPAKKPIAMQKKSVSIGIRVAMNTFI